MSEVQSKLYNRVDEDGKLTFLSDIRALVDTDHYIWSDSTFGALDYLRAKLDSENNVLVWDEFDPFLSERKLAGWGSVYLKHRLIRRNDFNTLTSNLDDELIKFFAQKGIAYLLIVSPNNDNQQFLGKTKSASLVWNQDNVFVFKLSRAI
jgi:hypothetical protein